MDRKETDASVGVIGLGYVGLPLVRGLRRGRPRVGFDIDPKVAALRAGRATSGHPLRRLAAAADASSDDAVRRPGRGGRRADLRAHPADRGPRARPRAAVSAVTALAGGCGPGSWSCWRSTTYPTTTRDALAPLLEEAGLRAARLLPGVLARADRPGRTDTRPHDPEGRRRAHAARLERAVAALRRRLRRGRPVSTPEVAELQDAREHFRRSTSRWSTR